MHSMCDKNLINKDKISFCQKLLEYLFYFFCYNKYLKCLFSWQNNNDEIKDDYSDLPPNQRKKKLNQKIENISVQISQENATK